MRTFYEITIFDVSKPKIWATNILKEYIEFNKTPKITSDFDKLLLETKRLDDKS